MATSLDSYTFHRLDADEQLSLLRGASDNVQAFGKRLRQAGLSPLRASTIETLQVNVGKKCNQTCKHCHVDAGPHRTEEMDKDTFRHCLRVAELASVSTIDITGGAPELNPHFEWFVEQARSRDIHVIDRCNLTITQTPSYAHLPDFFAAHDVEVVASLPHFRERNTDRQRGDGVFRKSIAALRELNKRGYGQGDPNRRLVLVTNPVGAYLPASEDDMERDWKRQLDERYGVTFDQLFCITNMPIARFLEWLWNNGRFEEYLSELADAFNPAAVPGVMCRTMLSVSWDGRLYDCDFNQMLELGLTDSAPQKISDVTSTNIEDIANRRIQTARHCYGCTAGAGSSCGGNTTGES
jgi:radical SAM/Cys-rich protein